MPLHKNEIKVGAVASFNAGRHRSQDQVKAYEGGQVEGYVLKPPPRRGSPRVLGPWTKEMAGYA